MSTWKEKHPTWIYIFWNETNLCYLPTDWNDQIDATAEWNGKADIYRWIILYHYGGVFVDADSICLESFPDSWLAATDYTGFAGYENESCRKGLIATGTMGFIPRHSICDNILKKIKTFTPDYLRQYRAWVTLGPALLTDTLPSSTEATELTVCSAATDSDCLQSKQGSRLAATDSFHIFPSYFFLPVHFTGETHWGHQRAYAYQYWATAHQQCDSLAKEEKPVLCPTEGVSVLVSSFNTSSEHVQECLESIREQIGNFQIQLVWVNDGSDNSAELRQQLKTWLDTTRWIDLTWISLKENKGTRVALNLGLVRCKYELIVKMDSDDIMVPLRIHKQIEFMKQNEDCVMTGGQIQTFGGSDSNAQTTTSHAAKWTWEDFLKHRPHWFMNHPTLCFRKKAIMKLGGYPLDDENPSVREDFDLEILCLKNYGFVLNLEEILVLYRIHEKQLTWKF
jgi:hypothetical protein